MDNRKYIVLAILIGFAIALPTSLFRMNPNTVIIMTCYIVSLILFIVYYFRDQKLKDYEKTLLSYRVKKVGEEVFDSFPVGIALYDDSSKIVWSNTYFHDLFGNDIDFQAMITKYIKDINSNNYEDKHTVVLDVRSFSIVHQAEEKVIYVTENTDFVELENRYYKESSIIGILHLDNYDEVIKNLDETTKAEIEGMIRSKINMWALENDIYIKKYNADDYTLFLNEQILSTLIENNFKLLDDVREFGDSYNMPITISMGMAKNDKDLNNLGLLANSSLELALSRGGDQVAIKSKDGDTQFFGGKTESVEKRNRVRARVISNTIADLINESSDIFVMGHHNSDFDSIGASIGIYEIARHLEKPCKIIFEEKGLNYSMIKLVDKIRNKNFYQDVITGNQAKDMIKNDSLLIIVDTHKPSTVISEETLNKAKKKVVIDHHRRGEEFVSDPILTYLEPYASSTCELITELMEYQRKKINLQVLESTIMLAGIIVDTKHFTYRTGSRTFAAASFLKTYGADTIVVQELMKEDIGVFLDTVDIIKNKEMVNGDIALVYDKSKVYTSVQLARAADKLLTFEGIHASFVVGMPNADTVAISARSLGEVNVQVIMEELGGGGHLTNAATQITDTSFEDVVTNLKAHIDKFIIEKVDEENESNIS